MSSGEAAGAGEADAGAAVAAGADGLAEAAADAVGNGGAPDLIDDGAAGAQPRATTIANVSEIPSRIQCSPSPGHRSGRPFSAALARPPAIRACPMV